MRFFKLAAFILLPLILTACGTKVVSRVTNFYDAPKMTAGGTYYIAPTADKDTSLEHQSHMAAIKRKLNAAGFTESTQEKADYAVAISYGIDGGKTTTSIAPIYGQIGGGYSAGSVYVAPTYGMIGTDYETTTIFTRFVQMDIFDQAASTADKPVKVFEGKAISQGTAPSFNQVSQCLIDALFFNFPGEDGKTKVIKLKGKECMK